MHALQEVWLLLISSAVRRDKRVMDMIDLGALTRPRSAGAGDTHVLVLPGFLATDDSLRVLRRRLRGHGYVTHKFGLGRHSGGADELLAHLDRRVQEIQAGSHARIVLVGWSLGGLVAREYAKLAPERVAAVVTLGSPFASDVRATLLGRIYEMVTVGATSETSQHRLGEKPPVPTVSIWSSRDGAFPVEAARGTWPQVDHSIEVRCAHMAYPVDQQAHRAVVDAIERFALPAPRNAAPSAQPARPITVPQLAGAARLA